MRGPIRGWRAHKLAVAAAALFAVPFVLYLLNASGGLGALDDEYEVRALLPYSSGLAAQSRVTMAGVDVGEVQKVQREGSAIVVKLAIDDDHAPIPQDTSARLRLRTLIGEKSIELTPGRSPRTLPDGGALPMSQDEFVEVDEILSELRGQNRERAQQTLRALGVAVGAKGPELNRVLENTSGMISTGAPVVRTLAREHRHITRLVANLGDLAGQVADRGDAMRTLSAGARTTFGAIARRDAALGSTLERLPATLDQVRRTARALRSATVAATPVVDRLGSAVDGLRPTVSLLGPAARDGRLTLLEAGRAAKPLTRTLTSLERFSRPGARTLPKIRSALCELNPLIRYISPYHRELAAVIVGLGSAVNAYDANGHISRLYIGAGTNSLLGAIPPEVAQAQSTLLDMGVLRKVSLLGYNPYPEPGKINANEVGRRSVGPADAENKYPRITADC